MGRTRCNRSPQRPDIVSIRLGDDRRAHILDGDPDKNSGGHRFGTSRPGKTEFPADWPDEQIVDAVNDVARQPDTARLQPNGRWRVDGTRNDVSIVAEPDGRIWAAYPEPGSPGVRPNPRGGET